ncbi:hypothetical protein WJX72_008206 [[Myrmecia] bisecta]|uniref:Uncharacterized protein n=1 Tax=[Myrmecia] bisecta TaxID=41462 RepID=A0AAW1Q196_9CHLO
MGVSRLPPGCRDAKLFLLVVTAFGDLLQGGITFGWNALSLMIKEQGNFAEGCGQVAPGDTCTSQENKLALIYILGVFATNFSAAFIGPVLDLIGPKYTACAGCALNSLGVVLFGLSSSTSFNAFIPASILVGLGGLAYHLAMFNASSLFPHHRGLASATYVAAYIGSAGVYIVWKAVYDSLGGSHTAYRYTLVVYGLGCLVFLPLALWINPRWALHVGQVYVLTKSWRFKALNMADLESHRSEAGSSKPALQPEASAPAEAQEPSAPALAQEAEHDLPSPEPTGTKTTQPAAVGIDDSAHGQPAIGQAQLAQANSNPGGVHDPEQSGTGHCAAAACDSAPDVAASNPVKAAPDSRTAASAVTESATVAGSNRVAVAANSSAIVLREPRRFVELQQKRFLRQLQTVEFFGLTAFFCLNVFILQFYLGTARIQLEDKGDTRHAYISIINIISALGMLAFPLAGWLLDSGGYALSLIIINGLNVASAVLQAVPNLAVQILQFVLWSGCRFLMYALYYTFIGKIFGYHAFGKLIGVTNVVNGVFGLIQIPLAHVALSSLRHRFWILNMADALVLLPLFAFCALMWRWERRNIIEHHVTGVAGVGPALTVKEDA